MKPLRPFFAALMLVAWLLAGAHMALEHGGDLTGAGATYTHCHEEDSAPADDQHHHHDFGAVAAGKSVTAQKALLAAPEWTPLDEQWLAQCTALLRQAAAAPPPTTSGNSPPDERASGWLFVSHTALPVRGPALV